MVRRLGELRLPMKPSRVRPALMHLGIREGVKVKFDIFQGQRGDEAENISLV